MAVLATITSKDILQSLLFAILGIISLVAIFLYKNRKKQILTTGILFVASIIVFWHVCYTSWRIFHFAPDTETVVAGLLSPVSAILTFLAIKAIRKDEKLVRSLDRLR
jgi:hypothetical protein